MGKNQSDEGNLVVIHQVPLNDINISEDNVRHHVDFEDLDELAASIKKHGLLQPVVLLGEFGRPPYKLIAGQRRFLAHQKVLKRSEIPAVFAGRMTRTQAIVRSLVENLQRVELSYEDTAEAVTELYKSFGRDERKVQEQTGLSLRKIRDLVMVQERASPRIKKLLGKGKVTLVDVKRAIQAAQYNIAKAEKLLDLIVQVQPTAHQKRRLVSLGEHKEYKSAKSLFEEAMKPHVERNIIIMLEDDIREALTKATKALEMEAGELASKAISDWLRSRGFIK